jgi:hypothetical protein
MLKYVTYWVKTYASGGASDQRCVQDFVECETSETLSTFRAELYGISQGNVAEDVLDKLVGQKRKVLHGSYVEWAKLMLMWLAAYNKGG